MTSSDVQQIATTREGTLDFALVPHTPSVLQPLIDVPRLRIAVIGRERSGKSTIVDALSAHAQPVVNAVETDEYHRHARFSPANIFRADLSATLPVRACVSVGRAIRPLLDVILPRYPPCRKLDFGLPHAPGRFFRIYDGDGEEAALSVAHARGIKSDVILFVTRLDDARSSREDAVALQIARLVFGDEVLKRMVIVLTHGCATPPTDLSYSQFVQGRIETIFRLMDSVFEPIIVTPEPSSAGSSSSQSYSSAQGHPAEDAQLVQSDGLVETPVGMDQAGGTSSPHIDDLIEQLTVEQREKALKAFESFINANHEDGSESDGSVTDLPPNFVQAFHWANIHPEDRKVYKETFRPAIVVVELSPSCPTDDHGAAILPDGTAWLPNLVQTIADVAQKAQDTYFAERDEARRGVMTTIELAEGDEHDDTALDDGIMREDICDPGTGTFLQRMHKLVRRLGESGIRVVFAQMALVALVFVLGKEMHAALERQRERYYDDSDTLLEMPEEDFQAVMRDFNGDKPIIVYHGMTEEEVHAFGDPDEDMLQRVTRGARRAISEVK